jgi:hypothetical protein
MIGRLRFTSALWLSRLRESQISTENSRTDFSGVHDPSPRVPLDLAVQIHFGSSGFGNLNSQLKPWCDSPRARDLLTCVLSKSTTLVSFGTSAFGDLRSQFSSLFVSPRMVLPRVHDLMTCVLPQIDGSQLLRLFGLRRFQTLLLRVLPECFHPEFMICRHVPFWIYDPDSLRPSGSSAFGASGVCLTPHLETSEVVFPEVFDLSTRISCRPMDRIYFGSSAFGSFKLLRTRFLPKCIRPETLIYLHVPLLVINDQDLLRVFTRSPQTYATCPLDPTTDVYFALQISGVSNLN